MATSAASLRQAWVSLGTSASKSLQQGFAHLEGPDGRTNVIAQASGQQVCILDGSYRLQTTLSFASSVPSSDSPSSHRKWYLHCLALGELAGERILAAASFDRVSIWTSSYSGDWRLHSSFDAGDVVTCLSLAGDLLLIGAESSLTTWRLKDGPVSSWTRTWRLRSPKAVTGASFDGTGRRFLACFFGDLTVFVWRYEIGKRPKPQGRLRHSRAVIRAAWRSGPEQQSQTDVVVTTTSDGVVRLWMAVIDEPDCYRLWSAIDAASFDTSRRGSQGRRRGQSAYLDAKTTTLTMRRSLDLLFRDIQMAETGVSSDRIDLSEKAVDLKRSRARRLEQFTSETPDMFLYVDQEGILGVRALAGVDRRPPTLCESFTALKIPAPSLLQDEPIQDLRAVALTVAPSADCDNATGLVRIQSSDGVGKVADFQLSPALLFDGHGQGLTARLPSGSQGHLDVIARLHSSGDALFSLCESGRVVRWSMDCSEGDYVDHMRTSSLAKVAMCDNMILATTHDGRILFSEFGQSSVQLEGLSPSTEVGDVGFAIHSTSVIGLVSTSSGEIFACKLREGKTLERVKFDGAWGDKALTFVGGGGHDAVVTLASHSMDIWTLKMERNEVHLSHRQSVEHVGHARVAAFEPIHQTAAVAEDSQVVVHDLNSGITDTLCVTDTPTALAWSPDTGNGPLLAVASRVTVEIYCCVRTRVAPNSDDTVQKWRLCARIDLASVVVVPIASVAWLSSFQLVIASSNQLYSFGPLLDGTDKQPQRHLAQLTASEAGPLPEYHPQVLYACLLIGRPDLARRILAYALDDVELPEGKWSCLEFPPLDESRALANDSIEHLLTLDAENKEEFQAIRQAIVEVDELKLPLDDEGLRYLVSLRCRLARGSQPNITWRDIAFAYRSDRQELLIQNLDRWYSSKIDWPTARAVGLFMWLRSNEEVRAQAELVARCQYNKGDDRDPSACSILYFALGKQKLVLGLWKQAYWHSDQRKMLQFLANDFSQDRWKSAALKNAFALLSQRRFEMAASFFLLGGSVRDAANVCIRNLDDLPLAVTIARLFENGDGGPVLADILKKHAIPRAIETGDRWLASWAFGLLRQDAQSLACLVRPLRDVARETFGISVKIVKKEQEDPALPMLYKTLRRTVAPLPLTSSCRSEARLVLDSARQLRQAGCHSLALELVRSWTFTKEEPAAPSVNSKPITSSKSANQIMETQKQEEPALTKTTTKAPSLIKRDKDLGQQGAQEFSMDSFGF